jgi:hypothetical protein
VGRATLPAQRFVTAALHLAHREIWERQQSMNGRRLQYESLLDECP